MSKKLPLQQYYFLKGELKYLEQQGKLVEGQADDLLQLYQYAPQKKRFQWSFVSFLALLGAILIGLGVLSFVASNWAYFSSFVKFAILLTAFIIFMTSAWLLEERQPMLSRNFYRISAFLYGAEIIYIGQLFHLGGNIGDAFLLWALGLIPMAIYTRDRIIAWFGLALFYIGIEMRYFFHEMYAGVDPSNVLFIIIPLLFAAWHKYARNSKLILFANFVFLYQFLQFKFFFYPVGQGNFSYVLLLVIPLLFYVGHRYFNKSALLFLVNCIMGLQWLLWLFYHIGLEFALPYYGVPFVIGLVFAHRQLPAYENVMKRFGFVLHFVTGIALTIPELWQDLPFLASNSNDFVFSLIFGLLYLGYGLYLVYRERLSGVIVVGALVFRFYVDLSLMFLDKSVAFILGGILFLALATWFEKMRKRGVRNVK